MYSSGTDRSGSDLMRFSLFQAFQRRRSISSIEKFQFMTLSLVPGQSLRKKHPFVHRCHFTLVTAVSQAWVTSQFLRSPCRCIATSMSRSPRSICKDDAQIRRFSFISITSTLFSPNLTPERWPTAQEEWIDLRWLFKNSFQVWREGRRGTRMAVAAAPEEVIQQNQHQTREKMPRGT